MASCLFCEIVAGNVPADVIYSDDDVVAFRDISPQAPTHILVVPRRHIPSLVDLTADDTDIMGRLAVSTSELANNLGLNEEGYRWVINCGEHGQQTVPHIHLHLMGGRQFSWPPG